ncbi:respiratory nitrate reductase subunit gamma [Cryobacterium breve]|jgi:nitrate reductase gamma subunit|uniref:Respiratory nitrate reductase subunit gamma n=1 Tax=Cryobacterium breve TaxID=1259258 RepID=A0ABY7NCL0_9MICO|nr:MULTISPECIES: respiratory nitrate reductase subunit gamma [Cryobacterium]MDY7543752.1 respiratory nitrate reductase subunit gamma [Cryobacterium sp. 5B3]MEA9997558.1 respiratory nitrate reductase subunit gamma [Cryobacterium sp. RTS3]MEB0264277.1 respiratory nitrate reductase subunit gamma [Cryobacterium sp. 10I5]MEB0273459.1 respiratory nitrate reductase subunit gamma [Cryobacterium sp. 5B3]WBM80238.1 respiratory nitrate reductase subunit gamma [Cryobacterium breve]
MNPIDFLLWVAFPYAAMAVFVVGHIFRYRHDQFGWTSRSSQVYENRLLRWGSPMFHYGILMVLGGHVVGLLVPKEWLEFVGVSNEIYHVGATWLGSIAAVLTLAGLAILIYRRRLNTRVLLATTVMDKVMYALLGATLLFGTTATVLFQVLGAGYDYRGTISPWVRGLLSAQPDPALMANVPFFFQLHVLSATLLFLLWPFTRLVHVFSAPIGYFVRPYIVYRSRDTHRGSGARKARRGWEKSVLPTSARDKDAARR